MARLPQVAREIAVTPQIQSMVTGADISAPYQAVARGLGALGSAISKKAADYEQMVEQGVVAKEIDAAKTSALNFAQQANGDATAFQTMWDTYAQDRLANVPQHARSTVEQNFLNIGGTTYRKILGDKFDRDQNVANDALDSRKKSLVADLTDLARLGQTTSDEYKQKHEELTGLITGQVSNPAFGYSQEHANLDIANTEDTLVGAAVTGELERIYTSQGLAAAQQRAREIMADKTSGLSDIKKLKAVTAGLSSVRALYTADAASRAEFHTNVQQVNAALGDGSLNPDDPILAEMISQAEAMNDPAAKLSLQKAQAIARLNPMKGMSLDEQLNFLNSGKGAGPAVGGDVGAAIDKGAAAAGIPERAGLLRTIALIESGGRPGASDPGNRNKGLFQLSPDIVAANGGGDVFNAETNARIAAVEIKKNIDAFQHQFGRAPTDAEIYMMHQQGSAGGPALVGADPEATAWQVVRKFYGSDAVAKSAIWGNIPADMKRRFPGGVDTVSAGEFLGVWREKVASFSGQPIPPAPAGVGGFVPGVIPTVRRNIGEGLDLALTTYDKQITTSGGALPRPLNEDQIAHLVDAARIVDDAAHYSKVAELIAKSDATASQIGTPVADHTQILDLMRAPGPVGDEAIRVQALDQAEKTHKQIVEMLDKDPRGLGIELGLFKPGPVVDWSNPGAASAVLASRTREMNQLELAQQRPPNSLTVLRPAEKDALSAAWTGATTDGRLALVSMLVSSLPHDRLMAVMAGFAKEESTKALAIAGALSAVNPEAGAAVIRGQAALATNPKFGFTSFAQTSDQEKVGAAMPPTAFAPTQLQAWQDHLDAAKAIYADKSAKVGDVTGEFKEDRWKQAVDMVTGGILEHNGQKIIAPVPGMTQPQFEALWSKTVGSRGQTMPGDIGVQPAAPDAFKGAQWPDGTPLTADVVRDQGVLHSSGDGRYYIEIGNDTGIVARQRIPGDRSTGPVIVPFELDLKKVQADLLKPARVTDYVPPPAPPPRPASAMSELEKEHAGGTSGVPPPAPPPTPAQTNANVQNLQQAHEGAGAPPIGQTVEQQLDYARRNAEANVERLFPDWSAEKKKAYVDDYVQGMSKVIGPQTSLQKPRGSVQIAGNISNQEAARLYMAQQGGGGADKIISVKPDLALQVMSQYPAYMTKPLTAEGQLERFLGTMGDLPLLTSDSNLYVKEWLKNVPEGFDVYRFEGVDGTKRNNVLIAKTKPSA